jgi:hypothetical protein
MARQFRQMSLHITQTVSGEPQMSQGGVSSA